MIDTKNLELIRAAQFQALADPVRIQIVAVLHKGPRCVCEIHSAIGPIAANLLSYHLGILRNAGLVTAQRRGRWLDYRLEYAVFEEMRADLPHFARDAQQAPDAVGRPGHESAAESRVLPLCVRGGGDSGIALRSHRWG